MGARMHVAKPFIAGPEFDHLARIDIAQAFFSGHIGHRSALRIRRLRSRRAPS